MVEEGRFGKRVQAMDAAVHRTSNEASTNHRLRETNASRKTELKSANTQTHTHTHTQIHVNTNTSTTQIAKTNHRNTTIRTFMCKDCTYFNDSRAGRRKSGGTACGVTALQSRSTITTPSGTTSAYFANRYSARTSGAR